MTESFHTTQLNVQLDGLRRGDPQAWGEIQRHLGHRLTALARRMLRRFPEVRRFEQTGDLLQNATVRLLRALREVRPDSVQAFFGLAALQMRRELLDLQRQYRGLAAAGDEAGPAGGSADGRAATLPCPSPAADELEEWAEFHRQIEDLPQEERQVVDLVFYQGLTRAEAAEVIGVALRTVQRRWHAALVRLKSVRGGEWPPV